MIKSEWPNTASVKRNFLVILCILSEAKRTHSFLRRLAHNFFKTLAFKLSDNMSPDTGEDATCCSSLSVVKSFFLFFSCAWRLDGRTLDDRYEGGWALQEIKVCRADTPLQGLNKLPHLWNISEREAEHFLVVKAYKRQKSIFRSDHTHADGTCSTLNRRRWKKWIRLRSCAGFDGTRRRNQNKPFMEAENRVFFRDK